MTRAPVRRCSAAALALALAAPPVAAQRTPDLRAADVDRFVTAYLARSGLPGAAVAIVRDGRVLLAQGYGRDGRGAALTARTLVPIASLSKSITALAVVRLAAEGRVRLDETVASQMPFAMADPRANAITVRELLTHRSGMADTEFREKHVPPQPSLDDAVALLRDARLASDPGARFHYHNPNYWTAARLVEVASGESFAIHLQRRVFEPLDMRNSSTTGSLRGVSTLAPGHVRIAGLTVARHEPAWYLDGASGVVTTAEDLARWLVVQTTADTLAADTLAADTLAADTLRAAAARTQRDSLGWRAREAGGLGHPGWLFTFTASQTLLAEQGYGIAVVANRGLSLGPDDAAELMRGLVALARGETPTVGPPVGRLVDWALLVLALLAVAAAGRAVPRSSAWAERWRAGARVRPVLGLLAWLTPLVLLLALRRVLAWVFGGRDVSWGQLLHVASTLVIALMLVSLAGLAVTLARARAVSPSPRPPRPSPRQA